MNNQFLRSVEFIQERLTLNPYVNTVLFGVSEEKDLYKKSIYPITHIVPVSIPMGARKLRTNASDVFTFEVAALDQRDVSKQVVVDKFNGNDNLQDNLNVAFAILNDLITYMKLPNDNNITLEDVSDLSPVLFKDFNLLDGWVVRLTISVPVIDPLDLNPSGSGCSLF